MREQGGVGGGQDDDRPAPVGLGGPGSGTTSAGSSSPTGTPSMRSRSRRPWLAWTRTPTVQPPSASSSTRDAVPTPPLKPWQIMPVPPPTLPSGTGPGLAASIASTTCSGRTCMPSMSFRVPSQVSPTTGRLQASSRGGPLASRAAIRASRTTPTLWVLVSATGEVSSPDSRTHSRPVSSPLPFSRWQPANTGSVSGSSAEGNTTVTPVRTSSPRTRVACPTRTPATSVIAFPGPGRPVPMMMPSSRARIGYQRSQCTTSSRPAAARAVGPAACPPSGQRRRRPHRALGPTRSAAGSAQYRARRAQVSIRAILSATAPVVLRLVAQSQVVRCCHQELAGPDHLVPGAEWRRPDEGSRAWTFRRSPARRGTR